jgi:5-methylcytosine-specific restriction endonuclease McrA
MWCETRLTAQTATLEHLISRKYGGTLRWGNLVLACKKCNNKRGSPAIKEEEAERIWATWQARAAGGYSLNIPSPSAN